MLVIRNIYTVRIYIQSVKNIVILIIRRKKSRRQEWTVVRFSRFAVYPVLPTRAVYVRVRVCISLIQAVGTVLFREFESIVCVSLWKVEYVAFG